MFGLHLGLHLGGGITAAGDDDGPVLLLNAGGSLLLNAGGSLLLNA